MNQKKITLYSLISKNIMRIVITGILAVIITLTAISYMNLKKIEDTFKDNSKRIITMTFNSLYDTIYSLDRMYFKNLDKFIENLKTEQNDFGDKLEDYISTNKRLVEDSTITHVNIEKLDPMIKARLAKLNNFEYFIEMDLNSKNFISNVYLKLENEFYLLKTVLPIEKMENILDNVLKLRDEYEFVTDINICTHNLQNFSDKFSEISEEDSKYLKQAFDTGKEVIIKKDGKINFYFVWKYSDEKILYRPLGIVLKLDFNYLRTGIILNAIIFLISLIIILFFISRRVHKVSKRISKPFELMLDNMKKFRETRYLEFNKIFEKCDIKEINDLMTEYQKMAEDIMASFEEINAMNEDLEISYKEIEYANNELEEAYLNFSTQLSIISEGYDENTGNHVNRVGELASFIARKLGMSDEYVFKMKYYAPLHDIGKLFIPKEILDKKGRLTEEEFELMKKHTLYGSLLIGDSSKFEIARKIALYHHEKYDGSGYPEGLKGDEIPLCAAIVSVVDVYDALRSERPYKPAFCHEKAVDIILNGDDRTKPEEFHPEVLKIFKEYEKEIKDLWEEINNHSSKLIELLKEIDKK